MPQDEPNLILGAAFFAESLMRVLGIKGNLPRELYPLYGVQFTADDLSRDEFAWTRRSTLWEFGATAAPVAAQLSRVALLTRTTAGSQRAILAVVDEIEVTVPTAGGSGIELSLTFLGTGIADPTANASRRDDRLLGKGTNAFSVTAGAAAASPIVGEPNRRFIAAANQLVNIKGPWILTNNDNGVFRSALVVVATTANVDLRVNFKWRERDLQPEEL